MFSKEIESDIIALPPAVEELTDKAYFDVDEMTTPSVKDLSSNLEICVPTNEIEVKKQYESIDIKDDGPNRTDQRPSSTSNENKNKKQFDSELRKRCVNKSKVDRKANSTKNKPSYTFKEISNSSSEHLESISNILGNMNPLEIFEEFFTPEFYEYIFKN
ncbi:uncharacterized protein TNCV_1964181 [Trichonephila clavipes]|nr:uncharacterized protein TNCV_1964181 [Trichonephila clavipes]